MLYWSFDTLENLTLMRSNNEINVTHYDPVVPGQVKMHNVKVQQFLYIEVRKTKNPSIY